MGSEKDTLLATATPVEEGWKSGICDCCKFGCCHKALCCAVCFPGVLIGQILTRMKMTWFGNPAEGPAYKKTFWIVFGLVLFNRTIDAIYGCAPAYPDEVDGEIVMVDNPDCSDFAVSVSNFVTFWFGAYLFYVTFKLRGAVRAKYGIPGGCCADFCTVALCPCCSAVQMAHQTADYETGEAMCCTTDGLSSSDENEVLVQAITV